MSPATTTKAAGEMTQTDLAAGNINESKKKTKTVGFS